jgi:hypothetical protein
LDEAGFSYVTKPTKLVTPKGTKRVYPQTTAEKGETVTVSLSVNAAGYWRPRLSSLRDKDSTMILKKTHLQIAA